MNELLLHILDSNSDHPLSKAEIEELKEKYPAFTLPSLMAVKSHTATQEDVARVAIALPSLDSLSLITGENAEVLANFYPVEQASTPSTLETIDTFLATYGSRSARENDILEKAIFNPVADMGAVLASEEKDSLPGEEELDEKVVGAETAAINRFIVNSKGRAVLPADDQPAPNETKKSADIPIESPAPVEKTPSKAVEPAASQSSAQDAGDLSESFARMMIKNRNYTKALEIISGLYLNNPEKSIYFADQIRFLRKLIANDNKKQ